MVSLNVMFEKAREKDLDGNKEVVAVRKTGSVDCELLAQIKQSRRFPAERIDNAIWNWAPTTP